MAVAAFATWHVLHGAARSVLDESEPAIVAHAALETFSVLTRLPPPHRAPGAAVVEFLEDTFADRLHALPETEYNSFLSELSRRGIEGGSTYDALIGAVARSRRAELLTCDERAAQTYERVGAEFRLVQ